MDGAPSYATSNFVPEGHLSHQVEDFPKDFFPTVTKKYSQTPYVYKHIYVTAPTKPLPEKPKKNKKAKEESWMDYMMNPFDCESDFDDYDDD